MKRLHYVMGISFSLLCGLIGWWWFGVYQEEENRLLLEANSKFQTWKSDAISETMTQLIGLDQLPSLALPAGAEADTMIRLDFTSNKSMPLENEDSLTVRIDVTSDSQRVTTERIITQSNAAKLITDRVAAANRAEKGSIRMVVLNLGEDSLHRHRNLLLTDTLSGGTFLGKSEFLVGYRDYRGLLLQRILPELGLGLLVILSLTFAFWLTLRNLREQRQALEAKDNFISNITHELKTPIATVGVALEALESFGADTDPTKRSEYLDIGRRELGRLNRLTERALGILQFDHHEVALDRSHLDLTELVAAAWDSLHHKYDLDPASLILQVAGSPNYYGDRLHLQNLVFNLLDNACKYGGDPPAIRIGIRPTANAIEVWVTDNGPGIAVAERDKIFRKFYRVRSTDGHRIKGHGLGLSYANEVAEAHGGTISVRDNPTGPGTLFVVTLPQTDRYV